MCLLTGVPILLWHWTHLHEISNSCSIMVTVGEGGSWGDGPLMSRSLLSRLLSPRWVVKNISPHFSPHSSWWPPCIGHLPVTHSTDMFSYDFCKQDTGVHSKSDLLCKYMFTWLLLIFFKEWLIIFHHECHTESIWKINHKELIPKSPAEQSPPWLKSIDLVQLFSFLFRWYHGWTPVPQTC